MNAAASLTPEQLEFGPVTAPPTAFAPLPARRGKVRWSRGRCRQAQEGDWSGLPGTRPAPAWEAQVSRPEEWGRRAPATDPPPNPPPHTQGPGAALSKEAALALQRLAAAVEVGEAATAGEPTAAEALQADRELARAGLYAAAILRAEEAVRQLPPRTGTTPRRRRTRPRQPEPGDATDGDA